MPKTVPKPKRMPSPPASTCSSNESVADLRKPSKDFGVRIRITEISEEIAIRCGESKRFGNNLVAAIKAMTLSPETPSRTSRKKKKSKPGPPSSPSRDDKPRHGRQVPSQPPSHKEQDLEEDQWEEVATE